MISTVVALPFHETNDSADLSTAVALHVNLATNDNQVLHDYPFDDPGAIVAIAVRVETAAGTNHKSTFTPKINGTAKADGSVELGATEVKDYKEFDKSVLPLVQGDTIGMEIIQDAAAATAPGNIEVIVYVQVGRSET